MNLRIELRRRAMLGISLLLTLLSTTIGPKALAAGEFKDRGFTLPSGAVRIDDDRYRLPMSWDDAVRFYRGNYPPAKYLRHTLRNQSGVRAMHIANARQNEEWLGANMYEAARGEVRIYVVSNADAPASDQ